MCGSKSPIETDILRIFSILFFLIIKLFLNSTPFTASPRGTTTMETVKAPPRRKRGAELSAGRRYAMVIEIA